MIFKLIGIAVIGVIVITLLKSAKPEFAVFATIATGVVMVITMLSALRDVVIAFDGIVEKSGIDDAVFSAVLKIIGIGKRRRVSVYCAKVAVRRQNRDFSYEYINRYVAYRRGVGSCFRNMKRKAFCDLTKTMTGRKSLKKRLPYTLLKKTVCLMIL